MSNLSPELSSSKLLADQMLPPLEICLPKDKSGLKLIWVDGEVTLISAVSLREHCRSAKTKKLKILNLHVPPPADLTISDVKLIGTYGLNIIFSDGFDRGIYPWEYLREIAAYNPLKSFNAINQSELMQ